MRLVSVEENIEGDANLHTPPRPEIGLKYWYFYFKFGNALLLNWEYFALKIGVVYFKI